MSFGQWYEDQRQDNDPTTNGGTGFQFLDSLLSSGGESDGDSLPLFSTTNPDGTTTVGGIANIKASLEAQLPQNVMGMNYQQRFRMFCTFLCLSALFFTLGFFVGLPTIYVRPQKFALCFTFGSLFFMGSFAILKGPMEHLKGMCAADRLPFTTVYLASMMSTLYFTFTVGGASGYVTVLASSGLQLLALLWYLVTFLPGGSAGMGLLMKGIGKVLKPLLLGCAKIWAMILRKIMSCLTG